MRCIIYDSLNIGTTPTSQKGTGTLLKISVNGYTAYLHLRNKRQEHAYLGKYDITCRKFF